MMRKIYCEITSIRGRVGFNLPEKEMSGDIAMTRVSPPTYLRTPSDGLGRILPPKLHMNFTLLLGDLSSAIDVSGTSLLVFDFCL